MKTIVTLAAIAFTLALTSCSDLNGRSYINAQIDTVQKKALGRMLVRKLQALNYSESNGIRAVTIQRLDSLYSVGDTVLIGDGQPYRIIK